MPRIIGGTLIVIAPLIILFLAGVLAVIIRGKRRRFKAECFAGAGVFLLIHAGFFAAPVLFANDLRGLALWLTAPVSVGITFFTLATMKRMHMLDRPGPFVVRILPALLFFTYWAPLAGVFFSQ